MANIPRTFDQIDQWKSLMFLYGSALKEINVKIEILNDEFIQIYKYNPIEHVKARLKSPESIVKKLKRYHYDVNVVNMTEKLNDIAGIRIICSFTSDIYQIADMISRQQTVQRFKQQQVSSIEFYDLICLSDQSFHASCSPFSSVVPWSRLFHARIASFSEYILASSISTTSAQAFSSF